MDFEGLERELDRELQGSSQPLQRLLRRARRAYADGDFETAHRILAALARAVPDSTTILYPLACALYRLGHFQASHELSNRLSRMGDTRGRLLQNRLLEVRAQNPEQWELADALKPSLHSSIGSEQGHYGVKKLVMNVHVSGSPEDTLALMRVVRLHEINFAFCDEIGPGVTPIHISDFTNGVLASVDRSRGILISTYQRDGICTYTGLDHGSYLLLCALLGVTQWRTLALNPLLVAEDFHHGPPCKCLFSHQPCKEDFALLLEDPEVCMSCLEFYRCLGVERDVDALTGYIRSFRTALSPFDSSSLA